MTRKTIRLCYRKVIGANADQAWDKNVFESTYQEFLLQAQFYNQQKKYTRFDEMLLNVRGADKLHFLVSAAVTNYLQQLGGKIPGIVNSLGKESLSFMNYQFELVQSDIKNKALHQVAINFYSTPLHWHETIDNYLLLSDPRSESTDDGIVTHLLQLQSSLGIYALKTEEV